MNESPRDMLVAYVRAFETLDANEVVPFYQLPCTFIRPDGVWVVSDRETAVTLAAQLIDHARSQGYVRTEVPELRVRRLAEELAMLTGVFVRYDAEDAEIARFGFSYVTRLEGEAWKIVVAIGHDATAGEEVFSDVGS